MGEEEEKSSSVRGRLTVGHKRPKASAEGSLRKKAKKRGGRCPQPTEMCTRSLGIGKLREEKKNETKPDSLVRTWKCRARAKSQRSENHNYTEEGIDLLDLPQLFDPGRGGKNINCK